ncbi:MAG: helix-turn-helix domain-containing protein [Bdellovibrionota bacterium]|nr:helix-turn-helix domain-containing protein [Bdellovibrionota bacterium]
MSDQSKNYYDVLEVETSASLDDIHSAYLKAKNAYSGDSLALYSLLSKDEADKVLELIEEAYTILSDPIKRQQYNDARGIANEKEVRLVGRQSIDAGDVTEDKENSEDDNQLKDISMKRMIVKNKYALEYKQDSEIEKEIEQCEEYTGEFLKKIREYKNVDIPRLAEMTKISKTYLGYIENEEVDKLPAPVYTRGFIYQYAKCLKLNPELVCSSYMSRLKALKQ